MANDLRHRGPDDLGVWINENGSVGLANTRLAIIDLECGKQPMISGDGRHVIVYNGEIYNYRELREQLCTLGHQFRTRSDTEVLLEGFREWGRNCLGRLRGMFAFAIYDRTSKALFIARDPTGIKPLYYHRSPLGFFFGSELKAILTNPRVPRRINYNALADYLVLGYPLAPQTFFRDCDELAPGTWLEVSPEKIASGHYWDWHRNTDVAVESGEEIESALVDSLREHLVSDVPVGAFLSGGIDSSLLAALVTKKLGRKIRTFTVKFEDPAYDESGYARSVAGHLGTEHCELPITNTTRDVATVNAVLDQFDQPFGDSSAIPTYLLCKEIRKHVKVVIGGDGGDEMFGGYERFRYADAARALGMAPPWIIRSAESSCAGLNWLLPDQARQARRLLRAARSRNGDRLVQLSSYISPDELPFVLHPDVRRMVSHRVELRNGNHGNATNPGGDEFMDVTISSVLPNDYLRKVDMMSSAHGLEVRVPFLGEQVLTTAARTPRGLKYSMRQNKIVLRQLASKYLPPAIASKPKWGFGIPLDSYLGTSGRRELQDQLSSQQAQIRQYISPKFIDPLLSNFVTQKWNRADSSRLSVYQRVYFLWSLERWLNKWNPAA